MDIRRKIGMNPYRVLGVYVGCSPAIEVHNRSIVSAWSKVGRTADFKLRGDDRLPGLERTDGMVEEAFKVLALPVDRIDNAYLWYADSSSPWALTLNAAVDSLLDGRYGDAIALYGELLDDDDERGEFVKAVTHGLKAFDKEYLAGRLADLFVEIGPDLLSCRMSSEYCGMHSYLYDMVFDRTNVQQIKTLLSEFMQGTSDMYGLMSNLKSIVSSVMSIMRESGRFYAVNDLRYKDLAETVARAIYTQGRIVVNVIGRWAWDMFEFGVWIDAAGNIVKPAGHHTTRTYRSLRLCMYYIEEVRKLVENAVNELRLDSDSYTLVADSAIAFEREVLDKYVSDPSLRRITLWHRIGRVSSNVFWLVFIIFITYVYGK